MMCDLFINIWQPLFYGNYTGIFTAHRDKTHIPVTVILLARGSSVQTHEHRVLRISCDSYT